MYQEFSAEAFKQRHNLPTDYIVDGLLVYGSIKQSLYDDVAKISSALYPSLKTRRLPDDFLYPILELKFDEKCFWFVTAYGGALLSEYVHIACLFGSKKNIVVGSCGGLYPKAISGEVIIPEFSFANESTTRAYSPITDKWHSFDLDLINKLTNQFGQNYKVWNGPTITHQAMLAETWDDVQKWSSEGFYGVEMEAGTVAAVSNHFNVPAVAILRIADNLIKQETVFDDTYQQAKQQRENIKQDILKISLEELFS